MSGASDMKRRWDQRAARDPFFYVESTFWDGDVEAFFALGEERTKALVDPVLEELGFPVSASSALEIGCGLGRFSRSLATRFGHVTAVDVSDEMVRRAGELSPPTRYPNLAYHASDGISLPFVPSETIDFALSYEVFQHMPSYDVIVANVSGIARTLKPSGTAMIHLSTDRSAPVVIPAKKVKRVLHGAATRVAPRAAARYLGLQPFTADRTWTGTALDVPQIRRLFHTAHMSIKELREDPTHPPGTRVFVMASPL